ncbi:hypothetical protein REPUB_Repub20aG0126200 [Reevesia pubescens]
METDLFGRYVSYIRLDGNDSVDQKQDTADMAVFVQNLLQQMEIESRGYEIASVVSMASVECCFLDFGVLLVEVGLVLKI